MTAVNRDVSRRAQVVRAIRGQLIPWLVVAANAVSVYLSATSSDYYQRYALSFDNDCGRLVSMPPLTALVMWLAFALAAGSIVPAVGWSRQRRRARNLAWFPVRGIGLALVCIGLLVAAWCFVGIWSQHAPYHVFCSNI